MNMVLGKKKYLVLKIINEICKDNTYKVIDISDFEGKVKKRYKLDNNELFKILSELKDINFIDIKYSKEDVFCLCMLPQGRVFINSKTLDVKQNKKTVLMFCLLTIATFLAAFSGAMLAHIIFNR